MTFNSTSRVALLAVMLLAVIACTPKEPATPGPNVEQLKMQSQMKALAAEVVKLRESRMEVEQLKHTIAAMDSQIAVYQTKLEEKAQAQEAPKIEVVAAPRDPDIINLRGNIYVLIREIDSLKEGMKDLESLNDSLEMQIEQLAVKTHTEARMVEVLEREVKPAAPAKPVESTPLAPVEPVQEKVPEKADPAAVPTSKTHGYTLYTDYRMAYNDALNKYFNADYLEAIQDFRLLIQREPQGAYADNAQYWIGECYYSMEDFESAITEFNKVFNFPENNKSDHALFKISLSYQQLGRYQKARESMNRFILEYPESELVSQAHDFLKDRP